ncbi:hypothetical protein GsuE55_09070 [Geobacillus subterraneus]|uniref:Uncharacterized protein n=1 Tax=Geobacillus subterraneus TaxID=129338 RepID=A0A679FTE2_9BACL|nr:hypothetical protein GsuE55_09070 [Geobacillus subterraneus]
MLRCPRQRRRQAARGEEKNALYSRFPRCRIGQNGGASLADARRHLTPALPRRLGSRGAKELSTADQREKERGSAMSGTPFS